jgi:2-polyprenyl-6-methoxyphenol hydroxylase-like FAD-dependent oxidoreductase
VDRSDAAVVVVGAGPVGLLAACELARRKVTVRVVDMLAVPTTQSRAIAVHARSLEMFDRLGLAGELLASGVKATRMEMYAGGERLTRVEFDHVDSAFPFTVVTAQTETERILTRRLEGLGVAIERGVELTGMTQDHDAVHLEFRRADGSRGTSEAAWVIGADGAHSSVRRLVGTRLEGSFEGERFLLGDVEAEHSLDRSSMYTYLSPDGLLAVFPMRDSRMRLIAQVRQEPGQQVCADPTQDDLQQIVKERAGGIQITASHWLTGFEIHHAQVPAYRFGRVFLAGDAAHVHSPAGGQGMNTGLQDAFNLGWKLALAVRGHGGDHLLDSYHAERHPVGARVIAFTTRLTDLGTVGGAVRTRLRNELVHAAFGIAPLRERMASQTEEITIAYRDSPLVMGDPARPGTVAPGDHAPSLVDAALQSRIDAAWGTDATGHLLLTLAPDRVPAAPARDVSDAVQVLVTRGPAAVPGYDAVIADPADTLAARYGLPRGGRVAVRPDGYVGLVGGLDDDGREYFAALAR